MIKAHNDELSSKLRQQKEDYDTLLSGKMEAEEILKLEEERLEKDTAIVKDQEDKLEKLWAQIEKESEEVNLLTQQLAEGTELKTTQEENNRKAIREFEARKAKKAFIEAEYDYTTHAEAMNLEIFRDLMRSNNNINKTVDGFITKVDVVKEEV